MEYTDNIIDLLNRSYSPFHVVKNIEDKLKEHGFEEIHETENYKLESSHSYYVKRNDTSIIAFRIPKDFSPKNFRFLLSATHNDSPTFKLKPNPVLQKGNLTVLDTEPYGGGIYSSWLDKPLSLAGRVYVREGNTIRCHFLAIDEDLLEIPSVCIHMNRNVNNENKINPAVDTLPIFGEYEENFSFSNYVLKQLGVQKGKILSHDLFLYNRETAKRIGRNKEFLASGRLDDLSSTYSVLFGYLKSTESSAIQVYASFDNEEVGSLTKQGANSTFLKDTLARIVKALGGKDDDYEKAISSSFMISVDNAHANHPNHSEYSDQTTKVNLNQGIVIKYNANQSYTSDALSSSVIKMMMEDNNIPYQEYTNRSDLRGGSTLGNLSNSEVSLTTVDIGLPQLSMHSSYEIMGVKDLTYMIDFVEKYFSTELRILPDTITF